MTKTSTSSRGWLVLLVPHEDFLLLLCPSRAPQKKKKRRILVAISFSSDDGDEEYDDDEEEEEGLRGREWMMKMISSRGYLQRLRAGKGDLPSPLPPISDTTGNPLRAALSSLEEGRAATIKWERQGKREEEEQGKREERVHILGAPSAHSHRQGLSR